MFDTAVEIALAAFCASPTATDEAILEQLEREGIEPWLAEQLVRWVPIGIARPMLERAKVRLEPFYSVGDRLYDLADEPVYVAARARAAHCTSEENAATYRRSPEFDAINNALWQAGPDATPEGASVALACHSKLEIADGDGGAPSIRALFAEFVEAHKINVTDGASASLLARNNPREWIERGLDQRCPSVGELRFDAWIYPKQGRLRWLQADFVVWHPTLAAPRMIESVVGLGETWREAIVDAVDKFAKGSLHAIIASLVDRNTHAAHTEWEPLEAATTSFDLCINAPISMYAETSAPDFEALLDALRLALSKLALSRQTHWLRVFVTGSNGAIDLVEVLLDNEPWTDAEPIVAAAGWELAHPMWAWRWFMVLVPS